MEEPDETETGGGLVFDDTSEFVRTVGLHPINPVKKEPKEEKVPPRATSRQRSESRDASMQPEDEPMEELEAGEVSVKDEEDDEAILNNIEMIFKQADEEAVKQEEQDLLAEVGGTAAEATFSSGMASTLNILRHQGILAPAAGDQRDREAVQLHRDLWLAEQRRRVAQRELDRLQARGSNKDQAQREYENRLREQQDSREQLEAFKHYKPDVKIEYHDEFGRTLTPKEAWKLLSHKFHGKGSGKMKTEKRLKKIAEEKKQLAMTSGDTPLSMNKAFQMRQEKTGQAHFVLSVGNRGWVFFTQPFLICSPNQLYSVLSLNPTHSLTPNHWPKGKPKRQKRKKKPLTNPRSNITKMDS